MSEVMHSIVHTSHNSSLSTDLLSFVYILFFKVNSDLYIGMTMWLALINIIPNSFPPSYTQKIHHYFFYKTVATTDEQDFIGKKIFTENFQVI